MTRILPSQTVLHHVLVEPLRVKARPQAASLALPATTACFAQTLRRVLLVALASLASLCTPLRTRQCLFAHPRVMDTSPQKRHLVALVDVTQLSTVLFAVTTTLVRVALLVSSSTRQANALFVMQHATVQPATILTHARAAMTVP